MMEMLTDNLILLAFGAGIGLIPTSVFIFIMQRLRRTVSLQAGQLNSLRNDFGAICSAATGIGEHVAQLERRAYQLVQRQDQLDLQDGSEFSYRRALKLARNGTSVEELMDDCGLARGEAELVLLAQRMDKQAV